MVWHSYMLNPRDFLEDCLRQGKMKFWRACLPWAVIDPCIDNNTFEYTASDAAMKYFEDRTGYRWNSLIDSPDATIECPACRRTLYVPWTRWNSPDMWTKSKSLDCSESYGESVAAGFSDKNFEAPCQCGIFIDHELHRVQKFRKDIQALRDLDVPMPGTIFSSTGSYNLFQAEEDPKYSRNFRHRRESCFQQLPRSLVSESSYQRTQQFIVHEVRITDCSSNSRKKGDDRHTHRD